MFRWVTLVGILILSGGSAAAAPNGILAVVPTERMQPEFRFGYAAPDSAIVWAPSAGAITVEGRKLTAFRPDARYYLLDDLTPEHRPRPGEQARELWSNGQARLIEVVGRPVGPPVFWCTHGLELRFEERSAGARQGFQFQEPPFDDVAGELAALAADMRMVHLRRELERLNRTTRYSFAPELPGVLADVQATLMQAGFDVALEAYQQGFPRQIVATLPGRVVPEEEVVLIAHIDSISPSAFSRAPGMNDNASSCAAWIASAAILARYPGGFARTVRVLLTTGEEQGLVGADAYARAVGARGDAIRVVLNAEMIGNREPGVPQSMEVIHDDHSRAFAETLARCIREFGGLDSSAVSMPWVTNSDHGPFWREGYAGVVVTSDFPLTDPNYHLPTDELQFLDLNQILATGRGMLAAAAYYAGPQTAPAPTPTPNTGFGPPPSFLGGFARTNAQVGVEGPFSVVAVVPPTVDRVDVLAEGVPAGIYLPATADPALFRLDLSTTPAEAGVFLLQLQARDAGGATLAWPYLDVAAQ